MLRNKLYSNNWKKYYLIDKKNIEYNNKTYKDYKMKYIY